ncbi:helix-turn-helix domain-containing protein [Paenibacillus sp. MBLB4367]|uniref:helix-turn-helix domain-containing protein n=1 Tax=Paenibacillus sp. MBLB4367 TaxID=3384767 RepID=UPI003907F754
MHYSLSRLSVLDVKWADLFDANAEGFLSDHYNPYYELIIAAEGTVYLQAGESQLTLQTGEAVLLKPWETHAGWKTGGIQGKFYWVQFSCEPGLDEFALNRAAELNIVHAERTELRTVDIRHEDQLIIPRHYRIQQRYKLLGLFESLVETMNRPQGYFRFHATLLLAEMLRLIADDFLERSHLDTTFPISYITFRNLVNHLNNSYVAEISKERLESATDRKYEYLCQVFKRYAGTSIHHYVQQLRVQRAKHLLHNTAKSVQEIARDVGYPDPFYFSRIFKKIEGVAPQRFRDRGPFA